MQEIATTVNGGFITTGSRRRRQADEDDSIPQIFEFTIAASTAPLVGDDSSDVTTQGETTPTTVAATTAGAPPLHVALNALSLIVLGLLSVLLG